MVATLQSPPPAGKPGFAPGGIRGFYPAKRPEFAVAPGRALGDSAPFMPASSAFSALRACSTKPGRSSLLRDERPHRETHHMSDHNQSGAPIAATGANASEPAAFGSFGATRGSGLARGKRPAPASASAPAAAIPSGYKPSSLEVITSKSEYVNPFTGETTVSAPPANEPPAPVASANVDAPSAAPSPAPQAVAPALETPTLIPAKSNEAAPAELFPFNPSASSAAAAQSSYVTPVAPTEKSVSPAEAAAKAELNILPTEEPRRPAVSWESSSSGAAAQPQRREERGSSRRDGREGKPFEPREPRRDERKFEPRSNQPYQPRDPRDERPERAERTPRPESFTPEKKSAGFFGWLKSLFGGAPKSPEAPTTAGGSGDARHDRDGEQGGRRRHRGGRGRGRGGFQGDRGGQPYQPRDPRDEADRPHSGGGERQHGGEPRGDGQYGDGGGRRRRRGGRGRYRGEGGGDRGGPRPEGQQGGGAI